MTDAETQRSALAAPLTLPCGVELKNRIAKAAMSDSLGDGRGDATKAQRRLYRLWAEGGVALSLIGEVQTSPDYPEKPGNLVLFEGADTDALAALADAGRAHGAALWPQLGHAGALADRSVSRPRGPSPLELPELKCEGMSRAEIEALPGAYARAATLAKALGFGGVQIHAGHGFLFSQFLSPLFNHREDEFGGDAAGRFRIIGATIDAVRAAVGPAFPIGIKINSSDGLAGGVTEDQALEVVRLLDRTSVDLIDVSGGAYFPGAAASSDNPSTGGLYFADFAKRAKATTGTPIMLTGGAKTAHEAAEAVRGGSADMIGLARALALQPNAAAAWLSGEGGDPTFPTFPSSPPGGITAWYSMRLTALANGDDADFEMTPEEALAEYEKRDAIRARYWNDRFGRPGGHPSATGA